MPGSGNPPPGDAPPGFDVATAAYADFAAMTAALTTTNPPRPADN